MTTEINANERYDICSIPEWVIKKHCGRIHGDMAGCFFALADGTARFTRETDKALFVEWENTLNSCKVPGGKFWVAKSLLATK